MLTGCGSSSSTSTSATTVGATTTTGGSAAASSTAPVAATPGTPNVQAQLLTINDFPAGWSVNNNGASTLPKCIANVHAIFNGHPHAVAQFIDGQAPAFNEEVTYVGPGASEAFARVAANYSTCTSISVTENGTSGTGTLGAMSFPLVDGHPTHAYQGQLVVGTVTIGLDLIYTLVGQEIVDSTYNDLGAPDVQQAEAVAAQAVQRVATVGH